MKRPRRNCKKIPCQGFEGRCLLDVVECWSARIARRVAPAELDFAPEVGAAYAAGGKARKELFSRSDVQPGAFGPGDFAADLPLILRGLADAGSALLALLRSSYLSNGLAAASLLAALRAGHHQEQVQGTGRETTNGPAPEATPSLAEKQAIEVAFMTLRDRLGSAGFSGIRADELAYELLAELLADHVESARFIDALTAVSDGKGRSGRSVKAFQIRPRKNRWP